MGALRILTLGIIAAASTIAASARADELIIPYTCEIEHGKPQLAASRSTIYRIIGPREDEPFSPCGQSPSAKCEMMMVHKFTIECGGQRVAWATVAASARALGVKLPTHLPNGFAPISRLAGRFVLPGLVQSKPAITRVATQDLSPDSVLITGSTRPRAEPAQWVTARAAVRVATLTAPLASVPAMAANPANSNDKRETRRATTRQPAISVMRSREITPATLVASPDAEG